MENCKADSIDNHIDINAFFGLQFNYENNIAF